MSKHTPPSVKPGPGRLDRRGFLTLSAGAVALPGLISARGAGNLVATSALAKPKRGGHLTWGTTADPVHLSPFGEPLGSTIEALQQIYESLVAWDKNLNIVPALATKWDIPDNTTYVFHLRPNVKFHSGKTLTADDVKYSLELQKSPPPPGINNTTSSYPHIASIDVMDPLTVKITQSQPDPSLLGYLAQVNNSFIVPQGLYDSDTQTHADGTGPFKLVEYVPNDHVTFARHPHYWNSKLPYLDGLTFKVLPDEPTRLTSIRAGAIDGTSVSSDSAKALATANNVKVLSGPVANAIVMYFKMNGPSKPWHDPRVRQAVNHAVDRQAIIDNVFGGQGHFTGLVPAGFGDWAIPNKQLATYEKYDKKKAKQLLKAAGYPNGFSFTLDVIAQPEMYPQVAQVVAAHLAEVGIKCTVAPLESATFEDHTQVSGDIDCALTGKGIRDDVSGYFVDVYNSVEPWIAGGWNNAAFNSALAAGLNETSAAKRKPNYLKAQEIILTDFPIIPLVGYMAYDPVLTKVKGMYVSYTGYEPQLSQVWLSNQS